MRATLRCDICPIDDNALKRKETGMHGVKKGWIRLFSI